MVTARRIGAIAAWAVLGCGGPAQPAREPARSQATDAPEARVHGDEAAKGDEAGGGDVLADDVSSMPAERSHAPFEATALDGPFGTIDEYLARNPVNHDEECGARPKPTGRPQRVPASGPVREGRLLRAPGSLACAPIEYCVLALRTAEGWFVRQSAEPCQGTIGPGRRVSVGATKVRWVAAAAGSAVLAIEETRQTSEVEIAEKGGHRDERQQHRESRYLTLCGAGASTKPSCTTAVVLSCPNANGETTEATWSLAEGNVTLESDADPDAACAWDGPFVLGTHPLVFP
jgi:hypothetical protein